MNEPDENDVDEIGYLANQVKKLATTLENKSLQTLEYLENRRITKDDYGDMQKLIVSIIKTSEIMFEELTGVEYS